MRNSFIAPFRDRLIEIDDHILSSLGIRNGCQLYAVPLPEQNQTIMILSSIPYAIWPRAFRLILNIAYSVGSLARATEIISGEDINILTSWAAGISGNGDGCWTSIVELPGRYLSDDDERQAELLATLTKKIEDELYAGRIQSSLGQFTCVRPLQVVRISPLSVLRKFHELTANTRQVYVGKIGRHQLDFSAFKAADGENSIYTTVIANNAGWSVDPLYCLLTPDTEERYICLTFLPRNRNIVNVTLEYEVALPDGNFQGFFNQILSAIEQSGLNLFSAKNFMLEKTGWPLLPAAADENGEKMDGALQREALAVEFLAETGGALIPHDERRIQKALKRTINDQLGRYIDGRGEYNIHDIKVETVEAFFHRCYFATNAKGKENNAFACHCIRFLNSELGYRPLNVDVVMGGDMFVYNDVVELIRSCEIVVSLHMPDTIQNKLEIDAGGRCCPSDWVLFEESFAKGNRIPVFRLIHDAVRHPRYSLGQRDFCFNDMQSFRRALKELMMAIEKCRRTDAYRKSRHRSIEFVAGIDQSKLDRDIQSYYCVRNDR